ncbi:MAG: hypothetical protein ACYC27_19765 [Armatimonadota bacterium]
MFGITVRYAIGLVCTTALVLFTMAPPSSCDENLKTPYIMLDPASLPLPATMGKPLVSLPVNPENILRFPADLGIPTITSARAGTNETIILSNKGLSLRVNIDLSGSAVIDGLRDNLTGVELLSGPCNVFYISGNQKKSSDDFKVDRWDAYQYPDYAELRIKFVNDGAVSVTWHARLFRTRPQLEQDFEGGIGDNVFGQVLTTKASLTPIMPSNLFGRGFTNGKPNIPDRHRFEIVDESDHLCYDPKTQIGIWGFVADIGGQERIASSNFALIQNPSFRTLRNGRSGLFVIQPFHGPVEMGFLGLRKYIQSHYAVQRDTPSLYEWNQFWLWQGGPTRVEYSFVTQKRMFDVLPRQVKMGLEEFHFDSGWENGINWQLATDRFPGGWTAIREFNRANGLAFHLWVNDNTSDSSDFLLDLIDKSNIYRLFMDRKVTEKTIESVENVRTKYPGFSTSCHNSTSRSNYYPWGNIHFLSDFNQIYFGEGQFWAWSNILPEAKIDAVNDPLFPQRTEAERFFSRHDIYAGDIISRSAAYQAEWAWPYTCIIPPHSGWAWFENRPIEQLKDRIFTYLACRFNYQWGFDPVMLPRNALDLHLACTAWFKANRSYLTVYQHVLDAPDGTGIDAAGHMIDGRGFIFIFNPSDKEQSVDWKSILWEPELELHGDLVTLSDWTEMTAYKKLIPKNLSNPKGNIKIAPKGLKVLGINLNDAEVLAQVSAERKMISYP